MDLWFQENGVEVDVVGEEVVGGKRFGAEVIDYDSGEEAGGPDPDGGFGVLGHFIYEDSEVE